MLYQRTLFLNKIRKHLTVVNNKSLRTMSGLTCTEVKDMPDKALTEWVASFDTVLSDCDEVLWYENQPIQGSVETINMFRDLGKKVFFLTNNSTRSRSSYKLKMENMGFKASIEEIIGSSFLAASYLKEHQFDKEKLIYIIGCEGLKGELTNAGFSCIGLDETKDKVSFEGIKNGEYKLNQRVGAVVIGFDIDVTFKKIMMAASYAKDSNVLFLATNPDENAPIKGSELVIPCTGSIISAVATAVGRDPIVLGKPSRYMYDAVRSVNPGVKPERTIMIGDRGNTDIIFGNKCSLQTLLVGTGAHDIEDVNKWEKSTESRNMVPNFFTSKLGDLYERMNNH